MIGQDLLSEICINLVSFCIICLSSVSICFLLFPFRLRSSRLGGPRWLCEGDESRGKREWKTVEAMSSHRWELRLLCGDTFSLRTASRDGFAVRQDRISHAVIAAK